MLTPLAVGLASAAGPLISAGIGGISDVVSGRRAARKRYERMVGREYNNWRTGNLGLSRAEEQQALGDTRSAIRGDIAGIKESINRGGTGAESAANLGALAQARANAIAKARTDLQAQSNALTQQRYAQLKQDQQALANAGRGPFAQDLQQAAIAGIGGAAKQFITSPESSRGFDSLHEAWQQNRINAAQNQAQRVANRTDRRVNGSMSLDEALAYADK